MHAGNIPARLRQVFRLRAREHAFPDRFGRSSGSSRASRPPSLANTARHGGASAVESHHIPSSLAKGEHRRHATVGTRRTRLATVEIHWSTGHEISGLIASVLPARGRLDPGCQSCSTNPNFASTTASNRHVRLHASTLPLHTNGHAMVTTIWTIAILLALLGLALFVRALLPRRTRQSACPKCRYSLVGLNASTCPECGRSITSTSPHKRSLIRLFAGRVTLSLVAALLLVPLLAICFPARTSKVLPHLLPDFMPAESHQFGPMHVRIDRPFSIPPGLDDVLRRLHIEVWPNRIESRARLIWPSFHTQLEDIRIELGVADVAANTVLGINEDLDGDSAPDLVFTSYSGGAHCCWTYTIFSLSQPVAKIAEISAENGAAFQRVHDSTGVHTVVTTTDAVWNYWGSCYACTPKPRVVLRFAKGQLQLAPDLMLAPLPPPEQIEAARDAARKAVLACNGRPLESSGLDPADLWRLPVELIYTGHEAEARRLLRDSWPSEVPGFESFLQEFNRNLAASAYYAQLPWSVLSDPGPRSEATGNNGASK